MNTNKSFAAAAVAAALVLGSGVVAVAADTPTPSPTTSVTSTPTPAPTNSKGLTKAQRQALLAKYRADLAAWQVQKDAWTQAAQPILDAYKAALATAKATRDAALAKLPAMPVKPANPFSHND